LKQSILEPIPFAMERKEKDRNGFFSSSFRVFISDDEKCKKINHKHLEPRMARVFVLTQPG
jgi:hypothetical protein